MDLTKLLKYVGCFALVLIASSAAAVVIGFQKGELGGFQQGSGQICGQIPIQYNALFTKSGDKWKVQPAFLAAMFYAGEHGNSWPEFAEHAELGTSLNPSPHNCNSDVGCIRGPMQIGEKNWPNWTRGAYGSSLPLERIEWTTDAIDVAAWHLAVTGAGGNTTDLNKLQDAASIYNSGRPWSIGQGIPETSKYVPRVIEAYENFYCDPLVAGECAQKVVQLALAAVGNPSTNYYSNGNLACAHFVNAILNQAGVLDRNITTAQGLWDSTGGQIVIPKGGKLDLSLLAPGDIVYFAGTYDNDRYFTHVGIYIGNDRFINNSSTALKIANAQLSTWNGGNYFAGAKRFCQ